MVALITGASGGLGTYLSRLLWEAGYDLILISRSLSDLKKTKLLLPPRKSQSCHLFSCDLSNPEELNLTLDSIEKKFSKLSLVINNAATHGPIGQFAKVNFQEWLNVFNVNLFSHAAICRKFIPQLSNSNSGVIVNIAGGGATSPRENFSAYAASKTAIVRFGEILALELAPFNISVNSISPGAMPTKLLRQVADGSEENVGSKELHFAKKIFQSSDTDREKIFEKVGELILFLVSPKGHRITGKLISAQWDNWYEWEMHLEEILKSDVYTIRRIAGRDRDMFWGDL